MFTNSCCAHKTFEGKVCKTKLKFPNENINLHKRYKIKIKSKLLKYTKIILLKLYKLNKYKKSKICKFHLILKLRTYFYDCV